MNKAITSKALILTAFVLSLLGFNSCSDNSSFDNMVSHGMDSRNGNVELSYVSPRHIRDNSGVLTLDTAKILIKDIKLNVANSTGEKNFKTGPFVLDLVASSTLLMIGSAYIPVGTYDKVNFKIHKLNPNEPAPDPDFVDGNGRYSVVVKGWYNGNHFIFRSDKTASQKLTFRNSLVVTETTSNITLQIQPYMWFLNAANEYMDPNDPHNRNEIEHNFRDNVNENFKAFQDNDKNGLPD